MTIDLSTVATVCTAILGMAAVMVLVGKVLSMLWQWKYGNEMKATMARIEAKLDAHLDWHGDPGGRPAKPVPPRPNGGQRTRRTSA